MPYQPLPPFANMPSLPIVFPPSDIFLFSHFVRKIGARTGSRRVGARLQSPFPSVPLDPFLLRNT